MKLIPLAIAMTAAVLVTTPVRADEDVRALVAQLVDSKQLDGYWHVDVFPERVPLVVSLPSQVPTISPSLQKFDRDIVFTHEPQKYRFVFWIKSLGGSGERKTIEFTYPPEGLFGTAVYEKGGTVWKLVEVRLREG